MEIGAWSRYGGKVYRSDDFSTTCRFDEPGIYAVFAEHNVRFFLIAIILYVTFMGSFIWISKGICGARPEGLALEKIQQPDLTSIYSFNRRTPRLQCVASFINQ